MDSRVRKCRLTCASVINVLSHPSNVHLCTFLSLTLVFPSLTLALPFPFLLPCNGSCGPPPAPVRVDRGTAVWEDGDWANVCREDDGSAIVSTSVSRQQVKRQ